MSKITTSITIDSDVKAKAQALFADLGLDLSTAINIFLRKSIHENAIPFDVSKDVPNADTIAAIMEAEEISRHPERHKTYSSFSELLKEVTEDV